MDRRYYEEELRYLREAGHAFAEAHPEEASHLSLDSVTDPDPYVERLLEGVAFLTGRIHQRLDDDFPQYTEGLLQLLCPHLLKPVPALTIVQLTPKPGLIQETMTLERGTGLLSGPVGGESVRCQFRTTVPIHLHPLRLTGASLTWSTNQTTSARLRFELDRGIALQDLDFRGRPLRLYFHADAPTASAMHLFCTRHLRGISLRSVDQAASVDLRGYQWVTPGGIDVGEGLLPYGPQSFTGARLLQEYLSFRQKFWFVDVHGIHKLDATGRAFEIIFHFDRSYPEEKRFRAQNIRLHCAPAINLFAMDAEPIRVKGFVPEYRVRPSARRRHSVQVYDVQAVTGVEDRTGVRHTYAPYHSFKHPSPPGRSTSTSTQHEDNTRRHFTTSRRIGPSRTADVYLSLGGTELKSLATVPGETLSVDLRCTNGSVPHEHLREGMVTDLAPNVPEIVDPTNLTRPTLIREPPETREYLWMLLSHLSFHAMSIATREALTGVIDLYDWTGSASNRRRIAGIRSVEWKPKEILDRRGILRGVQVTVAVQAGHFADEGDLCLFGTVLNSFLSSYATINSFVHLTVEVAPSGQTYHWRPPRGDKPLL